MATKEEIARRRALKQQGQNAAQIQAAEQGRSTAPTSREQAATRIKRRRAGVSADTQQEAERLGVGAGVRNVNLATKLRQNLEQEGRLPDPKAAPTARVEEPPPPSPTPEPTPATSGFDMEEFNRLRGEVSGLTERLTKAESDAAEQRRLREEADLAISTELRQKQGGVLEESVKSSSRELTSMANAFDTGGAEDLSTDDLIKSYTGAFNKWQKDNPNLTLSHTDPKALAATQAIFEQAIANGIDPNSQTVQDEIKSTLAQVAGQPGVRSNATPTVETAQGEVNTITPRKTLQDTIGEILSQGSEGLLSKLISNPEAFEGMSSADIVLDYMKDLEIDTANQSELELLNFLKGERDRAVRANEEGKALALKRERESQNFLDTQKQVALMRSDLELDKLAVEERATMEPLREKQARMESYMKAKLGLQGLTASASGLSILMSEVRLFDSFVESTGMKFNLARQELMLGTEELMLQYTAKQLENKQATDNRLFELDSQLNDRISEISKDTLLTTQQARVARNTAINNFLTQKLDRQDEAKKREIEIWKEQNEQQKQLFDRSVKLSGLTGSIWSVDESGELFDTGIETVEQRKWQSNKLFDIGKFMIKESGIKGARQVELMFGLTHGALGNDMEQIGRVFDEIQAQAIVNSNQLQASVSEPTQGQFLLYQSVLKDDGTVDPVLFEELDAREQRQVESVLDYVLTLPVEEQVTETKSPSSFNIFKALRGDPLPFELPKFEA